MSNANQKNSDENLEKKLFDGLNEHGFLFQEKCADLLKNKQNQTKWRVQVQEYPVSTNVKDTRIDILLRDTSTYIRSEIYAIVECKRVSPACAWLFGNPLLPSFGEPLLVNLRTEGKPTDYTFDIHYHQLKVPLDNISTYLIDNWWLEVGKRRRKNASPQPIEDAFTQLCIGVSGIAQEQEIQWRKASRKEYSAIFIPVLITTAPLYVAVYDLKDVDLASGKISPNKVCFGPRGQEAEKVPWLIVDYGASRSISAERLYEHAEGISPVELEEYYKRSIYVVNSEHIVEFFTKLHLE